MNRFSRGGGGGFRGSGRPRRPMDWVCGEIDSETGGVSSPTAVCEWLGNPAEFKDIFTDPTAMALRVWGQTSPTVQVSNSVAVFAFGIIAWNYTIDAAGNTVVPTECPNPIDQCDADWLYLYLRPSVVSDSGAVLVGTTESDRVSRARRRLGNDRWLLLVASSKAANYNYHFHVRALIKE